MKLRHKSSGEIWEVEHFVARDAATGGKRVIDYLKGYEIIPDEPTPKPSATDTELNRVTAWVTEISKQVNLQGSDIRGLTNRLNAIEGNWR